MQKEENPKITQRSTRSSSYVTVENPKPNESQSHQPTIDDLTFGDESITLDAVLSNFPGRCSQILDLIRLLGPLDCPTLPIMAYGGISTGKTSVVLQVFKHLNLPFVYSSCRTCYNPRILFESILNKLLFHRKCSSNGYSSAKRCDKLEQEAVMKGPGSFPLERLMAIFQCIASVGDSSFSEEDEEEEKATGYDRENNNLISDIPLQVSSLCDANFIIKSGSCPLEGSIRYRSMVTEDLALKLQLSTIQLLVQKIICENPRVF